MVSEIALPRGALLLEETAEGARSFAVGFWFPLGSRHEAPAERGFTHFVEHLVFKGSARRSAQDFAREVDRVGGYLNAFTERDSLCFHCVVPSRHWRLALDILVDLVFCATFPEEEVEKEREVIASEILAAQDDPEEASHDAFIERIWPGQAISRKIAGEVEDVRKASRDELHAFYRKRLCPSSLLVSVSGPSLPGEVAEELASLLSKAGVPDSPGKELTLCDPAPSFSPVRDFLPASIGQVYLFEALQLAEAPRPDDYYVLSVLNGAFGESMSSRLFQDLRERSGLCYSVYSTFSLDRSLGLWMASASSAPRLFPRLLEGLDRQIESLAQGGRGALTAEEIGESVSRIVGSFDLALEDPEYRMRRLARMKLCDGQVLDVESAKDRFLKVGTAEVEELASRLFRDRPRATFAYGKATVGVEKALGRAHA